MIDQIKQAMRMWSAGHTHGDIKEVTGLSREVVEAATEIASRDNLAAEQVYAKAQLLRPGMLLREIEAIFAIEG